MSLRELLFGRDPTVIKFEASSQWWHEKLSGPCPDCAAKDTEIARLVEACAMVVVEFGDDYPTHPSIIACKKAAGRAALEGKEEKR